MARVITPPIKKTGHVVMDLCTPMGSWARHVWSKSKSGTLGYTAARKSHWGDMWPLPLTDTTDRTPTYQLTAAQTARAAEHAAALEQQQTQRAADAAARTADVVRLERELDVTNPAPRRSAGEDDEASGPLRPVTLPTRKSRSRQQPDETAEAESDESETFEFGPDGLATNMDDLPVMQEHSSGSSSSTVPASLSESASRWRAPSLPLITAATLTAGNTQAPDARLTLKQVVAASTTRAPGSAVASTKTSSARSTGSTDLGDADSVFDSVLAGETEAATSARKRKL
jgi:hypothetical protein